MSSILSDAVDKTLFGTRVGRCLVLFVAVSFVLIRAAIRQRGAKAK
jgi:hypothetical protein